MRRQRSLLPYQPAPISPTRLGLPLPMSSASAPSADTATETDAVWRNRRRVMLKLAPDVELKTVDFMWGSMNRALKQCNHLLPPLKRAKPADNFLRRRQLVRIGRERKQFVSTMHTTYFYCSTRNATSSEDDAAGHFQTRVFESLFGTGCGRTAPG